MTDTEHSTTFSSNVPGGGGGVGGGVGSLGGGGGVFMAFLILSRKEEAGLSSTLRSKIVLGRRNVFLGLPAEKITCFYKFQHN